MRLISETGTISYQRWRTVLGPCCTYHYHSSQPCTCSLSLLPLSFSCSLSLSLTHTHTHVCACGFQLGFFSLKTQWNLTAFDSGGFHIDPAMVTDIRQLDDNCCLMAEAQVSLMADDNRQLWVMDGFDEKLQSWNKCACWDKNGKEIVNLCEASVRPAPRQEWSGESFSGFWDFFFSPMSAPRPDSFDKNRRFISQKKR